MNWDKFYSDCDSEIRVGQIGKVRPLLLDISLKTIPRRNKERIAYLHNRTGLFLRGLEILWPVIHEDTATPATQEEKITYALILTKLGSYDEALKLLDEVPHEPRASLARAYCYQASWRSQEAIPLLRQFIAAGQGGDYELAVARVNLAAALIASRQTNEARELIEILFAEAKQNRWTLLFKNLQELSGQIALFASNLAEAEKILKHAGREHYLDDSTWDFYVAKWLAFVGLRANPESESARAKIQKVAERARELHHWESLRECDRELALAKKDKDLLAKIYFGTPFHQFRARLVEDAKAWLNELPSSYIEGSRDGLIYDLAAGQTTTGKLKLKPGQLMHRTFNALTSDLFRPSFIGALYSRIFPHEHFHPTTGPQRVAAATQRLRQWFAENDLHLDITAANNFYQLHIPSDNNQIGLLFSPDGRDRNNKVEDLSLRLQIDSLRKASRGDAFTTVDAASYLKLSRASAARILSFGVKSGLIEKSGSARYTLYKCASGEG